MPNSVSIVIVNYNSGIYLKQTVDSILENATGFEYEIIVVDNNSSDKSADLTYPEHPVNIILNNSNEGFGKANNIGVAAATMDYILILNNDTLMLRDTVPPLLKILNSDEKYGVAAPLIMNPDRSLQPSYGIDLTITSEFVQKFFYDRLLTKRHARREKPYTLEPDWVTGACFLIKKSLYQEIGGFDENYFIYVEDADLCRRIRNLGYKIVFTSEAEVIHFKGKSTSACLSFIAPIIKESQLYYYKTHNSSLSLMVLKMYLRCFYSLKKIIYKLKGDENSGDISDRILKSVKEFR